MTVDPVQAGVGAVATILFLFGLLLTIGAVLMTEDRVRVLLVASLLFALSSVAFLTMGML